MGLTGEGTTADELWELGTPRGDRRAHPRARRRAARGQGGRGRRGGLGDRRAARPDPDHRLAVGRAPDRARRHAPRHRPARLRPAGPAQRVQARGVRALRGAARPHPPRRRVVDLPRHRHPPARRRRRRRSGRGRLARPGSGRARAPAAARTARTARAAGTAAAARRGADGGRARRGSRRPRPSGGSAILRGGPAAPPTARPMRESLGDEPVDRAAAAPVPSASGPKPGFTPSGARIGRNDPCWCGSGAKYKKCHGR